MKRSFIASCVVALALTLVLGGCDGTADTLPLPPATTTPTVTSNSIWPAPSTIPEISLGISTFGPNRNIIVPKGTAVKFIDPTDTGGHHYLYTGLNGSYQHQAGAPAALETATGIEISAGQTKTMIFATPGTYTIACSLHPGMNAQVTVRP